MSQVAQSQTAQTVVTPVVQQRVARVNLLPSEIEEARRLRRTQAGLAAGLGVVVLAVAGVYALQVQSKNHAADELAATKADTVRLQAQQAKYADVPRTIAAIDAAETARSTAMANDVEWFRTLNNFSLTLPSNVWFTGVSLALNGTGSSGAAPAAPAAGTTPATPATPATPSSPATNAPATGIGVLTVQGSALDHPDVATWLDVLARQPGMADAYFSTSAKAKVGSKTIVNFVSTATVTSDALSHRYDRKQG
jgi:Tfp pilus assembly protein PilN